MAIIHGETPSSMVFRLQVPIYLFIAAAGLTSFLVLILHSKNSYHRYIGPRLQVPIYILLASAVTGLARCLIWVVAQKIRVRWLPKEGRDGKIKLGDEDSKKVDVKMEVIKAMLSLNGALATALAAAFILAICNYVKVGLGGHVMVPVAVAVMLIACILHIVLAIPGLSDRRLAVDVYPFKKYEVDENVSLL